MAISTVKYTQMSFYWCGTWQDVENPPTPEMFLAKKRTISYLVYQKVFDLSLAFFTPLQEMAPTTGKLHYQCYFEFTGKAQLSSLMKQFPQCFWSLRRGSAQQASDYCQKLETRIEPPVIHGAMSIPSSTKKPFHEACDRIIAGTHTAAQLARSDPYVFTVHRTGLHALQAALCPARSTPPRVIVLYGMPDSGKTRLAYEIANSLYNNEDIFKYDSLGGEGQEWWEGYGGQQCVIIDEFLARKFNWDRFLTVLDRYPTRVPVKGGSATFNSPLIIVTSNFPPCEWFDGKDFSALRRRITTCYKFCVPYDAKTGEPEMLEDGSLNYVPRLDLDNMRLPDNIDHNRIMFALNCTNGYAFPAPPREISPRALPLNMEMEVDPATEQAREQNEEHDRTIH